MMQRTIVGYCFDTLKILERFLGISAFDWNLLSFFFVAAMDSYNFMIVSMWHNFTSLGRQCKEIEKYFQIENSRRTNVYGLNKLKLKSSVLSIACFLQFINQNNV